MLRLDRISTRQFIIPLGLRPMLPLLKAGGLQDIPGGLAAHALFGVLGLLQQNKRLHWAGTGGAE
jgi:hypothetical protein